MSLIRYVPELEDGKYHQSINNAYIRLTYMKDIKDVRSFFLSCPVYTNISDKNKFVDDLEKYEIKNNQALKRGMAVTYGIKISLMIDNEHEYDNEKLCELSKSFCNEYLKGLPVYCLDHAERNGKYLDVYVCEREYYPEGKECLYICKSDRYKNKITKKITTKDDPNAILFAKKGDILSRKEIVFSKKVDTFRFCSKKKFHYFICELKDFWMDLMSKILKIEIINAITLKKIRLKGRKDKVERSRISKWNCEIDKLSDSINGALSTAKDYMSFSYGSKCEKKLIRFIDKINDYLRVGVFNFDKIKGYIRFDYFEDYEFEANLFLYIEKVKKETGKFIDELMSA